NRGIGSGIAERACVERHVEHQRRGLTGISRWAGSCAQRHWRADYTDHDRGQEVSSELTAHCDFLSDFENLCEKFSFRSQKSMSRANREPTRYVEVRENCG